MIKEPPKSTDSNTAAAQTLPIDKEPPNNCEINSVKTSSRAGAFLLFLPIVPIIATIICIATYLGMNLKAPAMLFNIGWLDTMFPVLVGTVSTLVLWIILSFLVHRFTAVDKVNEQSYYALMDQYSTLKYYTEKLPDETKEVVGYLDAFCLALNKRNSSWILGKGYIDLWALMNSAEEALITAAPLEKVIADAVYDEMRLNDSNIVNSEEWANKLRLAVNELDPDAVSYLKPSSLARAKMQLAPTLDKEGNSTSSQQPPAIDPGGNTGATPLTPTFNQPDNTGATPLTPTSNQLDNTGATPLTPTSNQPDNTAKQQGSVALAILRAVRKTINDFNANSWEALINARNQLYSTMILVGLTVFVFVALAIILHVNLLHLEAATFYAFVGGIAGLVGRLSLEAQSDKTIDNYRLSLARLMVTPLLSSLAAVIGVLIVAKVTDLSMIYNVNASLVPNLIIAATFGLSPNLLINQLQKQSDQYKGNLKSTQPTSGK